MIFALLNIMAELDYQGVLESVYDVEPDGDAPLERALRKWRQADYPVPPEDLLERLHAIRESGSREDSKQLLTDLINDGIGDGWLT